MYDTLTEVKYLAEHHGFRFVPAAGANWQGNFDLGKQPLIKGWASAATTDTARLEAWAKQFRNCNWLYVPGETQGVLDVDPRHGGDALLRELEAKHGPLPRTATTRTGGGGWHYHFTVPPALSLCKDVLGNAGLTLACGGTHGFIIPPCPHASGGRYAWQLAPWDCAPAPCPAWLLALAQPETDARARPLASTPTTAPASPFTFTWGGGSGLASHPGERTGNRHATLCVLVGRELARGRNPDEIEPELLAWADRCDPPLEHQRALRQLRSLSRKHEQQSPPAETDAQPSHCEAFAGDVAGAVASGFLPSPFTPSVHPSPPVKAGEGCEGSAFTNLHPAPAFTPGEGSAPVKGGGWLMHGFAGELATAIGPELEGSVEPVVCCLLSCFGSAIGPGPWVSAGADRHKGNIFGVCVAPSGVGKSEPWAVCSTLMQYADAEWHRQAVTYGLGSGEGLIERLETQPIAFAVEAEFGGLLAKARREGATLTPTICNAWDGRRLEVSNRGKAKLRAEGHHVSIWANITDAELHKRLSGSLESVNGFGNRFLWIRQQRVRMLPFGGDMRCLEPLGAKLRPIITRAKAIGRVQWGDDARHLWEEAYAGLCASQEAMPCLGRARSQALRLTLLYALLDGSDTIRAGHVRCGLSAWAWAEASARTIFGAGDGPSPGTGTAQATAPAAPAPALSFVWGSDNADAPAHAEASAEQQPHTAKPTGGVSPAKAVGVKARALARINAQPGILRGDLLRRVKAKAAELDAALVELEAKGEAFPQPSPGGKGEGWWPGAKPEPSPDKGGEKSSHPSPFTGGEAFTPAQRSPSIPQPSPVKGEGSGERTAHQQQSGSVHQPSPFTPAPLNAGGKAGEAFPGEGSGSAPQPQPSHGQPSQVANAVNAAVGVCCPADREGWDAEDLAFLAELEQTDVNAPGWDSEAWAKEFREGRGRG